MVIYLYTCIYKARQKRHFNPVGISCVKTHLIVLFFYTALHDKSPLLGVTFQILEA